MNKLPLLLLLLVLLSCKEEEEKCTTCTQTLTRVGRDELDERIEEVLHESQDVFCGLDIEDIENMETVYCIEDSTGVNTCFSYICDRFDYNNP